MLKPALLALLVACAVAAAEEPKVIHQKGQDHFETSFASGQRLKLDVRSGDVQITGSNDNVLSIRYDGRQADEIKDVEVDFIRTGDGGTLRLNGGPRNDFHIRIAIPRQTDLHIRMPFGALELRNVAGDKNVSMHAGDVSIEMGDPKEYAHIEASVTTGGLDAPPLEISKGGLFRSFKRDGPGKYRLYAHVGSGSLELR